MAIYYGQPFNVLLPDFGDPRDIATLIDIAEEQQADMKRQGG